MQDLSQQADRRVAQLGLVDSSDSDSHHNEVEPSTHVRATDTSASNVGGKSLKSGKESKITTAVLFPQLWPHSFISLTNARRDIKYDDLTLEEFVVGYGQIFQSPNIVQMECPTLWPSPWRTEVAASYLLRLLGAMKKTRAPTR